MSATVCVNYAARLLIYLLILLNFFILFFIATGVIMTYISLEEMSTWQPFLLKLYPPIKGYDWFQYGSLPHAKQHACDTNSSKGYLVDCIEGL